MPGGSGFKRWLIDLLIQPQFQGHPAAGQTALAGFLSVTLAAVVCAIVAFLFKLWRERAARTKGARFIAYGPRRSLIALILWLFIFIIGYVITMLAFATNSTRLIGPANMMTIIFFGSILYASIFLLLHLPAHSTHMPWRRVK